MSHSSPSSTTTIKILLVGSNPSIQSQSDFAFFMDTKSGKTLKEWTDTIPGVAWMYGNVSDIKTEKNRPLKRSEILEALPVLRARIMKAHPYKVVALGKTAEEALTLLGCPHLAMPHPSGLNRQLNDPVFKAQKLKELADYCQRAPSELPKD
jgi:uracil-DNA glycosylase